MQTWGKPMPGAQRLACRWAALRRSPAAHSGEGTPRRATGQCQACPCSAPPPQSLQQQLPQQQRRQFASLLLTKQRPGQRCSFSTSARPAGVAAGGSGSGTSAAAAAAPSSGDLSVAAGAGAEAGATAPAASGGPAAEGTAAQGRDISRQGEAESHVLPPGPAATAEAQLSMDSHLLEQQQPLPAARPRRAKPSKPTDEPAPLDIEPDPAPSGSGSEPGPGPMDELLSLLASFATRRAELLSDRRAALDMLQRLAPLCGAPLHHLPPVSAQQQQKGQPQVRDSPLLDPSTNSSSPSVPASGGHDGVDPVLQAGPSVSAAVQLLLQSLLTRRATLDGDKMVGIMTACATIVANSSPPPASSRPKGSKAPKAGSVAPPPPSPLPPAVTAAVAEPPTATASDSLAAAAERQVAESAATAIASVDTSPAAATEAGGQHQPEQQQQQQQQPWWQSQASAARSALHQLAHALVQERGAAVRRLPAPARLDALRALGGRSCKQPELLQVLLAHTARAAVEDMERGGPMQTAAAGQQGSGSYLDGAAAPPVGGMLDAGVAGDVGVNEAGSMGNLNSSNSDSSASSSSSSSSSSSNVAALDSSSGGSAVDSGSSVYEDAARLVYQAAKLDIEVLASTSRDLASALEAALDGCPPGAQRTCLAAWAAAKLELQEPVLLDKIKACFLRTRHQASQQGLSMMGWSLATLGHRDAAFMEVLAQAAASRLQTEAPDPQSVSNLAWSISKLGCSLDTLLPPLEAALLRGTEAAGHGEAAAGAGSTVAAGPAATTASGPVSEPAGIAAAELAVAEAPTAANAQLTPEPLGGGRQGAAAAAAAEAAAAEPAGAAAGPRRGRGASKDKAKGPPPAKATTAAQTATEVTTAQAGSPLAAFEPRHLAMLAWALGEQPPPLLSQRGGHAFAVGDGEGRAPGQKQQQQQQQLGLGLDGPPAVAHRLLALVADQAAISCGAHDQANVAWALAQQSLVHEGLLSAAQQAALRCLPISSSRARAPKPPDGLAPLAPAPLSKLLWAAAALGQPFQPFFVGCRKYLLETRASKYHAKELVRVAAAFAQAGYATRPHANKQLYDMLVELVLRRKPELTPAACARLMHSLSLVGPLLHNPRKWKQLDDHAIRWGQRQGQPGTPQAADYQLQQQHQQQQGRSMPFGCGLTDLADWAESAAKMMLKESPALPVITAAARDLLQAPMQGPYAGGGAAPPPPPSDGRRIAPRAGTADAPGPALVRLVSSLSTLGALDPLLVSLACSRLVSEAAHLSPDDAARLARTLGTAHRGQLGAAPRERELLSATWAAVLPALGTMPGKRLVDMAWGLVAAGYRVPRHAATAATLPAAAAVSASTGRKANAKPGSAAAAAMAGPGDGAPSAVLQPPGSGSRSGSGVEPIAVIAARFLKVHSGVPAIDRAAVAAGRSQAAKAGADGGAPAAGGGLQPAKADEKDKPWSAAANLRVLTPGSLARLAWAVAHSGAVTPRDVEAAAAELAAKGDASGKKKQQRRDVKAAAAATATEPAAKGDEASGQKKQQQRKGQKAAPGPEASQSPAAVVLTREARLCMELMERVGKLCFQQVKAFKSRHLADVAEAFSVTGLPYDGLFMALADRAKQLQLRCYGKEAKARGLPSVRRVRAACERAGYDVSAIMRDVGLPAADSADEGLEEEEPEDEEEERAELVQHVRRLSRAAVGGIKEVPREALFQRSAGRTRKEGGVGGQNRGRGDPKGQAREAGGWLEGGDKEASGRPSLGRESSGGRGRSSSNSSSRGGSGNTRGNRAAGNRWIEDDGRAQADSSSGRGGTSSRRDAGERWNAEDGDDDWARPDGRGGSGSGSGRGGGGSDSARRRRDAGKRWDMGYGGGGWAQGDGSSGRGGSSSGRSARQDRDAGERWNAEDGGDGWARGSSARGRDAPGRGRSVEPREDVPSNTSRGGRSRSSSRVARASS